ncbi:PaaI family thioesterase [Polaromonas sp.]|uniref:PaaI family thioesterase n=1 Tax=Polaromonas sp. TaxID=1869339 RepID=UPI0017C54A26|nr:PaaI family thioesterase [Polaromonas sp.]NMM05396.1 PaaI family thioesterase [Polaromonas sp.]
MTQPNSLNETVNQTLGETLHHWIEQGTAVRARVLAGGGKPGIASLEQIAGKTGLEIMQAMLAGVLPYPHIANTLDFALVEVERGKAIFQGSPQLKHYNPMGSVHGGWYATLLDSAVGCAVHTMLPAGRTYTTAELSLNIVRAASHKSGPLRAIGSVIHCGRQLATAEGRIVGADGTLYAHATTTCLVLELPPPRPTRATAQ